MLENSEINKNFICKTALATTNLKITMHELPEAKGTRQLRLSYGFEELGEIELAVILMKQAVEYAETF